MTNNQAKMAFKKLNDIDIINNSTPWKINVLPDFTLMKQLFSQYATSSTISQTNEDELFLSYKK